MAPTPPESAVAPPPTPTPTPTPPAPAPALSAPPTSGPAPSSTPSPDELRQKILGWLREHYRDVTLAENGWITVPDIGPSVLSVEVGELAGRHLSVEVFAPLVLDVPLSPELLRYVATEGARFHFGVVSLDVDTSDDSGDGEQRALVQFSHTLLADGLRSDDLLAVVYLVASTVAERSVELQRRFGGALLAELRS